MSGSSQKPVSGAGNYFSQKFAKESFKNVLFVQAHLAAKAPE